MKNYLPLARKNLVFFTGGKMLRGAFPELDPEILRFAQDDKAGLRMTGEGGRTKVWAFLRGYHSSLF
jgi:hypothetical protein